MSAKSWILSVTTVALAALYIYLFTDWLRPPHIQILLQNRRALPGSTAASGAYLLFTLDGKYRLTDVKVTSLAALATNKLALPVWHLVSETNSRPVKGFVYGQQIPGMQPAKSRPAADELLPDTAYRLDVEAGRAKGEIVFHTPPAAESN